MTIEWGPVIGAGVQALGSVAGSILGRGSTDYGQAATEQRAWDYATHVLRLQNDLAWRTQGAKAAGIHPLAAIGIRPAAYPTSAVGGKTEDSTDYGLPGAAAAIAKAIGGQTQMDKDLKKIAVEQEQVKLEMLRLNYSKSLAEFLHEPGGLQFGNEVDAWHGIPGQGVNMQKGVPLQDKYDYFGPGGPVRFRVPEVPFSQSPGIAAGIGPLEALKQDKAGYIWFVPEKDVVELMEENLDFKVRYYGMKLGEYYEGWMAHAAGPDSEKYQKWEAFWMNVLPAPPAGTVWMYVPSKGQFRYVDPRFKADYLEHRRLKVKRRGTGKTLYDLYRLPKYIRDVIGP